MEVFPTDFDRTIVNIRKIVNALGGGMGGPYFRILGDYLPRLIIVSKERAGEAMSEKMLRKSMTSN